MSSNPKLKAIGFLSMVGILVLVLWGLGQFWTLQDLKQQVEPMSLWVLERPFLSRFLLLIFFALLNFFSIPLASLTALLAGAVLGTAEGTLILSLAGSLGGAGTFLLSRWLLGPWVEKKWASRVDDLRERLGRKGPWLLLSLRLQPICPYFLVNLFFGLTQIRFFTFWWISLLAIVPNVLVWVYAGTLIMELESLEDAVSPTYTLSLLAIAILPWLIGQLFAGKKEKSL
jgi:uncharacterized membrane protein YdjX (TVP38/TMEM64 family)